MTDNSQSKYFLLSDTMDDMLRRLSRLSCAEKKEHQLKIGKLVNVLMHDVMPHAVAQPNVEFQLYKKLKHVEQSRPTAGAPALSSSWGYESYETYHEHHLVVNLYANVASRGPKSRVMVAQYEQYATDEDNPLTITEQDILTCYLMLQHLFGPEPDTLSITLKVPYSTSCSLCQSSSVNVSTVQFKPHETVEELIADLTFEGIDLRDLLS